MDPSAEKVDGVQRKTRKGKNKLPANRLKVQHAGLPLCEFRGVSSIHCAVQCLTVLAKVTLGSSSIMSSIEERPSAVLFPSQSTTKLKKTNLPHQFHQQRQLSAVFSRRSFSCCGFFRTVSEQPRLFLSYFQIWESAGSK